MCQKCGACCKNHPYVELSSNEIKLLEQISGLNSEAFIHTKEENNKEYFLQFQKNGDCFFLTQNNGNYSCCVYKARPDICKNYPSTPEQYKVCNAHYKKLQTDSPA